MKLDFEKSAFDDFQYWVKNDRRKATKILQLIEDIEKDPFSGLGKPEPLKFILADIIINVEQLTLEYCSNFRPLRTSD